MSGDTCRFISLATEIVKRIEEADRPKWWDDVWQLSAELECIRRSIAVWKYNRPEWPAFFIANIYEDRKLYGIAAEFSAVLLSVADNIGANGVMLSRDPMVDSSSETMLWWQAKGCQQVHHAPDTKREAILRLRRWIRAMEANKPTGGKVKPAAHAKKAQLGDEQPKEGHRAEVAEADRPATKAERRSAWIGRALMLRKGNPEMTKAEIARTVEVHPGQLSPTRFPELAALEKMLRGDTTSGHLTKDSESGFSDVEAADTDDKSDRGVQIAGSNYFREYCVECDEPMRVLQDNVGTGARCEGCAP